MNQVHRPFAGKVALVTGASRGIGAVTAQSFAQAGAAVVLAARDRQALDEVAGGIHKDGGQALVVPSDLVERLPVAGRQDDGSAGLRE